MTTRTYLYTDVNAPSFSYTGAGAILPVLDAVLVNGYGTKASLGWTIEYTGSNIRVYRNSTTASGSTGMYLYVDDNDNSYTKVRAYKTMSDINTGTDQTPPNVISGGFLYWSKDMGSSTNIVRAWCIIGDERTFYFSWVKYINDPVNYRNIEMAGDFDSALGTNPYAFCISGQTSTSLNNSASNVFFFYENNGIELVMTPRALSQNASSFRTLSDLSLGQFISGRGFKFSSYVGYSHFTPMVVKEMGFGLYGGNTYIAGKFRGVYRYLNEMVNPSMLRIWGPDPNVSGKTLYEISGGSASYGFASALFTDADW